MKLCNFKHHYDTKSCYIKSYEWNSSLKHYSSAELIIAHYFENCFPLNSFPVCASVQIRQTLK